MFIRTSFGQRYFALSEAVIFVVVFKSVHYLIRNYKRITLSFAYSGNDLDSYFPEAPADIPLNVFLVLFLAFSVFHKVQIQTSPSTFDFQKFSLYSGDVLPIFSKLKGLDNSIRTVETLLEPGIFFVLSFVVAAILPNTILDSVLFFSSIFYSLSYIGAYHIGDNFVLDKIDERICNEDLKRAFVDGLDAKETRGVRFNGKRPPDPDLRRELADDMIVENSEDEENEGPVIS